MLHELFNTIKSVVTTHGESDPRPNTYLAKLFHKPRYDEVVNIIKEHACNTIDVLVDVGCGRGALYEFLLKAKMNIGLYVCCDINKSYLFEIEGRVVEKILCDAQSMPFRKGAADLVVCSEVLEHLKKPFKALLDIFRMAKNYVLITFPHEKIKNALGFKYPEHISEIELKDVMHFADRLGYKAKLHRRLYFAFPPSLFDKLFSFSHRKLKFFSLLLAFLSSTLRKLCLIKTEIILFYKKCED